MFLSNIHEPRARCAKKIAMIPLSSSQNTPEPSSLLDLQSLLAVGSFNHENVTVGSLRGQLLVRTSLTSLSVMYLLPCQVQRHEVGGCHRRANNLDEKRVHCSIQVRETEVILTGAICLMVEPCELLFSIRCTVLRSHLTFQKRN